MVLEYGETATNIEELREATARAKAELRGEEYVPASGGVPMVSMGDPAVAEKLATGEAANVTEAVGMVSYEQAGYTVEKQPDGSLLASREIQAGELPPEQIQAYVDYAAGEWINPYTGRIEQAPTQGKLQTQTYASIAAQQPPPPIQQPRYILPPPTGQYRDVTSEAYTPIPITIRDRIEGVGDFYSTHYLDQPPRQLTGEYYGQREFTFSRDDPTILSEWQSGIVKFFGYGTEEEPRTETEYGDPLSSLLEIKSVYLPKEQYGQQTLISPDFLETVKQPYYGEYSTVQQAGGFGVGFISTPIQIFSAVPALMGRPTEIQTEYPLTSEFRSGFQAGAIAGEILLETGLAKLVSKIPAKAYDIEVPIGVKQRRSIYAQRWPAAYDFDKETGLITATLRTDKKPILYIPDEFEFKWLKAEWKAPVQMGEFETVLGRAGYGKGIWSVDEGITLSKIDELITQKPVIAIIEDAGSTRYLQRESLLGSYRPESKKILLRTKYDDWFGKGITRKKVLRHEVIHSIHPDWSEELVEAATKKGVGIPDTEDMLWPVKIKGREEIFIADISGVYPEIDIPTFDNLGQVQIIGKKTDLKPIGDVVQEIYGTKKIKITAKTDKALRLPTFKFGDIDVQPKTAPVFPAYREMAESGIDIITTVPPEFKQTEQLSIRSQFQIRKPRMEKIVTFKTITKRVPKLSAGFALQPKRKPRMEFIGAQEFKTDQLLIQRTTQAQRRRFDQKLTTKFRQKQRQQAATTMIRIPRIPPPTLFPKGKKRKTKTKFPKMRLGGRIKIPSIKPSKRTPYADLLSVTITKGRYFAKGKKIRATHPRSEKILWREFKSKAGFRVRTVEMLESRKGKKGKKKRKKEKWF
jgi:hypothetical protein